MVNASPDRAVLIVQAMADRPDSVVLSAVLDATKNGDRQVRLSAIDALKRVGDDSCLATLLQIATANDTDLTQAAADTLAELPGESVDEKIVARLSDAEGDDVYPVLLELVGRRRIDAVPDLVKAMDHSDPAIRGAALIALGETVKLERLSLLISEVLSPKHAEDAEVAQQALKAASVRMPDRDACATELAAALQRSPAATKTTLMEILAEVGGNKALMTLAAAAKSDDPQQQDDGSRLLGKWNSVDAAPVLLDLATTAPGEKYQIRALRGYIGVARKFDMPPKQRAEMCRQALEVSSKSAEKQLVLDALKLHPSNAGLKLAIEAMQDPEVKDEAKQAALVIAKQLKRRAPT